jgi:hypothetical protein
VDACSKAVLLHVIETLEFMSKSYHLGAGGSQSVMRHRIRSGILHRMDSRADESKHLSIPTGS